MHRRCEKSCSTRIIRTLDIATSNPTRWSNNIKFNEICSFLYQCNGGVEVLNAGGDGWKGDDVYQLLMQAALVRGGAAESFAADLSASGSSSLDARYVSFGSLIIELLDYHSDEAVLQRSLFPKFSESNVAPSVAGNMHISFNVRPEKNLNEFVVALEKSAHEQGYYEVICNR